MAAKEGFDAEPFPEENEANEDPIRLVLVVTSKNSCKNSNRECNWNRVSG